MADLIRRPEISYEMLSPVDPGRPVLPREIGESVQTELKYEGYVKKQADEAQRQQKLEKPPATEAFFLFCFMLY